MKSYLVLNHYVFNKHYESLPNVFVLLLHYITFFPSVNEIRPNFWL